MNRRTLLGAVAAVAVAGSAALFAADKPKDDKKPEAKPPVNKTCPVEKGHDIDPKVTTTYKDKVVAFCCADCIDEFKKDPDKYMKGLDKK